MYWTVVLADSLAIVTFPQSKIKMSRHYSLSLGFSDADMNRIVNGS
jgi:hypothetical protein